jgi:hydroxylaminobenzene mutase
MKLTKREVLFEGAPSRASVIQSRFAAYPPCSADQGTSRRRRYMTESGSLRTKHGRDLLRLGAVLLLLGLLTGLGIPHFAAPRQALSAHLLAVTQATLLMVLGVVWPRLKLTPRQSRLSSGLGIYGFPAAWLATLLAALWKAGATMMPMSSGGVYGTPAQELAIRLLLISGALCQVVFAIVVVWGLRGSTNAEP